MLGHVLSSNCKTYFQVEVGGKGKKKIESDCIWEKNVPGEENESIYDTWPCNNKELSSCISSVKGNKASNVSWTGFIL